VSDAPRHVKKYLSASEASKAGGVNGLAFLSCGSKIGLVLLSHGPCILVNRGLVGSANYTLMLRREQTRSTEAHF